MIAVYLQPAEIQTVLGLVRAEAARWRDKIRNHGSPPAGWQEHVDHLDLLNDRVVAARDNKRIP